MQKSQKVSQLSPVFRHRADTVVKGRGFTLVELLVALAIVTILTLAATPSFARLLQSTQISSSVNTFVADMRFARSESVRRGGGVTMCRSDAPEAASPSCDSGGGPGSKGWSSGWVIFLDANNNGAMDPAEPVLRVQAALGSVNAIRDANDAATKFRFTATGRILYMTAVTGVTFGAAPDVPADVQRVACVNFNGGARIAGNGSTSCGAG